jgi:hypothetical protein
MILKITMQTLQINDASMKEAELALRHITIFHQMQSMIYALYYQL